VLPRAAAVFLVLLALPPLAARADSVCVAPSLDNAPNVVYVGACGGYVSVSAAGQSVVVCGLEGGSGVVPCRFPLAQTLEPWVQMLEQPPSYHDLLP